MPDIPEKIGKYKVAELVAKGGMGAVYLAMHPTLKRKVIIKKLTIRGNKSVLERFKREARLLLELKYANIVHMYDYFTEGSVHYIVLEFVDGMSLNKLIAKKGKLAWPTALLVVRDACKALQFAHSKGVIHRDIKPGNILLSTKGEIKLADFGIAASATDEVNEEAITHVGATLGTPAYMPPEQFTDSKSVDGRADLYSMGVMFYEMVTGKKPYSGNMAPETLAQIQNGKYISPSKLEHQLPKPIVRLICKMMQSKPNKRFQDATKALKAINRQLKQFNTKELRTSLVKLMISDKYKEPIFVPKNQALRKRLTIAGAILAFSVIGLLAWENGFIHRYLLHPWYTPISLTLKTPKSTAVNPDIPMNAFFFLNDVKDIPKVPNSDRVFQKGEVVRQADVYTIKPVYLRPGNYRIKVVAGSYLWWQSIRVDSSEQVLNLDFLANQQRPLVMHTVARDMQTNQNLTRQTEFSVLINDRWVSTSKLSSGQLTSGAVWKIRAEADGYKTEIFSLRIEWYQDELFISALLQKE